MVLERLRARYRATKKLADTVENYERAQRAYMNAPEGTFRQQAAQEKRLTALQKKLEAMAEANAADVSPRAYRRAVRRGRARAK